MIKKLLRQESGYSLPELVVAVMLLSVAIIPMVGMFDTALNAATTSGDYDRARALANQKLERAKGMPYETLRKHFPETPPTETTYGSLTGYYESSYRTVAGSQAADFSGLQFMVAKQYLRQPTLIPSSSSEPFEKSVSNEGVIKVTVTVRWDNGKTYKTSGVVTRGAA